MNRGKKPDEHETDTEASEQEAWRLLRFAAVVASFLILGTVVVVDVIRDGTFEATSIGLLTGVVAPVVTILVLKGGDRK